MLSFFQSTKLSAASMKRWAACLILALGLGYGLPGSHGTAKAGDILEYQVKAAFIYNFIAFTQWPGSTGQTINLCLYGEDYFGDEIDKLQSKPVGSRTIKVLRINDPEQFNQCQAIFFSQSISNDLTHLLSSLTNTPILTLADTPSAASKGIAINMSLINEKVVFEINLRIARQSGLDISSKLLQLAAKVYQQ